MMNIKMINKLFLIISLLLISILSTSCAGPSDLNELGIIMSTGLDLEDGKVVLTNEVMTPSSGPTESTKKNEVLYIQSKGDTVFEAYRNATLTFDRKLFLSHNSVLIFGEEFAKRGIGDYLNFYLYDHEPREVAYMLVAKGAKAYDVMGINSGLSDAPGEYLTGLIEGSIHNSKTRSLNMNEYFKYFFERGSPVLGVVEKEEMAEINKEEGTSSKKRYVLNVMGGAPFRSDALIGYYTGDEMLGFNFIVDEIEGGLIVFETPEELTKDVKHIATKGKFTVIEIKDSKTNNKIEIVDGQPTLTIDVNIKGVIGEETKGLKLTDLDTKRAIEKACSDKVKDYINMTMDKAQAELHLDTFGIDALFHMEYPEEYRKISDNWDSIFSEINYTVNVDTNILRTGLINVPTNIKKEGD